MKDRLQKLTNKKKFQIDGKEDDSLYNSNIGDVVRWNLKVGILYDIVLFVDGKESDLRKYFFLLRGSGKITVV